jgi:protein-S-isoprenylcysteine O-methyltransferase Ste14
MLNLFLNLLVKAAKKERSERFKRLFLFIGFLSFLVITPLLFTFIGDMIAIRLHVSTPRLLDIVLGIVFVGIGLSLAFWTVWTQCREGGIPLQVAPPQRLITTGPYVLCRNPMFLGAILYYFGLGSLLFSIIAGFLAFILGFLIGGLYHRFIEEKELVLKFGEEYEAYRRRVPFLLPRAGSSLGSGRD